MSVRRQGVLVGLAVFVCACACACTACQSKPPTVDPSLVFVDEEHAVLKNGLIGASERRSATYALVDVTNRSTRDRVITMDGTLVDAAGQPVGPLSVEEQRVPAGQTQTFALVSPGELPAAAAHFHLIRVEAPDYPAPVLVSGQNVTHGDLTVVTATVKNTVEKEGTAVVVASFHDAQGRILARPFSAVDLGDHQGRVVRFEGPPESTSAVIFIGEVAYH